MPRHRFSGRFASLEKDFLIKLILNNVPVKPTLAMQPAPDGRAGLRMT